MKCQQSSEILFSTSSAETRDLVVGAQWPIHLTVAYVENIVDSLAGELDAADYDCLIVNDDDACVRDLPI
jgi:hypothetical protein